MSISRYDAIIVGGGHNGLVAATYLAKAGKSVLLLEGNAALGGATTSIRAFPAFDARLSRYSYLVSLLPDKIVQDLGLTFKTLPRDVMSYTPFSENGKTAGLLVDKSWNEETKSSFASLSNGKEDMIAWRTFYDEIADFAQKIAPTFLEPLLTREALKKLINLDSIWQYLIEEPIGKVISERFKNDVIKGVILTDALIGTFVSAFSLQANICFLYHLIGNGTGEWKVPEGGMGALVSELHRVALAAGVEIRCNAWVNKVDSDKDKVMVTLEAEEVIHGNYLLSNAAPQVLAKLRGIDPPASMDGSQMKINMLVKRLPEFKSGVNPKAAFAGTLHINESFSQLEHAYQEAKNGHLPSTLPLEIYCHTLTDPTILGTTLQQEGYHTMTLFGIHTPAFLFDENHDRQRDAARDAAILSLNQYLIDPIESVLAESPDGKKCIEVKSPLDIEAEIRLPRGNIFHKDLSFPFREENEKPGWGVETDDPRIFVCGAGAKRGGGVSGIPGHNAAMAVLEKG
jgi:phytoene dehydrogenase-like protein